MATQHAKLFEPSEIGHLRLSNRLVVAPMTRVSAYNNGCAGPLMKDYYTRFAKGGFGLIVTEGLYTDELYSQGYRYQPGLTSTEQGKSWKPIIESVHTQGSAIIAQLMHAGALSQFNRFSDKTVAPSVVQPLGKQMPFYEGTGAYLVPEEISEQDINDVIKGFVTSAKLAKSMGFDGVEIHGANGYLLDQFLTEYTNQRKDKYGGSVSNRLRIYGEIVEAVRAGVGDSYVVGVRFSQKKVNDATHIWADGETVAAQAFELMREKGANFIHTTEPVLNEPAFTGSKSLALIAKKHSGLPVIANGGVVEPDLALSTLENDQADFVALGKIALSNQDWPTKVKNNENIVPFDYAMFSPKANLESAERYCSNMRK